MSESYIIAIDFGSAYSGYAFSITPRGAEPDPHLSQWGKELGLESPKAPTCILFNRHEEFLHFGYKAKTAYVRMTGEEAKAHFFFENFKMALYGTKQNNNVRIEAANRKSMRALKVFTEALRFLKEDALNTIKRNTNGRTFIASDFIWVLTVPAIWDPSAKQFMREAAIQAEIVTKETEHKLIIALEAEAASVWCKKLPAEGFITENHGRRAMEQSPGTRYMVVDCGGGTIDITVHEVLDGGALKELHKASGNDLGGQRVDRKFKEFLREIFCDGVWDEYEGKHPNEVLKIMNDFVIHKKEDNDFQISCLFNLGQVAKKRQELEKFFESVQGASWNDGWIKISKEKLRSFFAESLEGITDSLREIFWRDLNIEFILLVGGYAESQILRQHVIDQFGDRCKVLCPSRPQEAIVKGAFQFGRNPGLVASRKSAFTYGVSVSKIFIESKHRPDKKYRSDTGDLCCDIFMKLVEKGEDIGWNETRQHFLYAAEPFLTTASLTFYRSERTKPSYVDDPGVDKVASFHVKMPDTARGINRKVKLEIKFGSTEITAIATDISSGTKGSAKINFETKE